MTHPDNEDVILLRMDYPKGTRVRFLNGPGDDRLPPPGTIGVVKEVNALGVLIVDWKDKIGGLLPWLDTFEIRPFKVYAYDGIMLWKNEELAKAHYEKAIAEAPPMYKAGYQKVLNEISQRRDVCYAA